MIEGSDYPWVSFYPFNHENAFEETHLGYLPLVVISLSLSLSFLSVEELVDGCQRCLQSLVQGQLKWNESHITRKGRMCVCCGILLGNYQEHKMQRGTHSHTYNISLGVHSLYSFINVPESLPDRLILTCGKFIFGTSADLYALTMVSPQVNKNPGPTLDTKPYLLSHKL